MYSLLIKNGQLFDPDSGLSRRGDIALDGRRIAAVGDIAPCDAAAMINAEGCIVTPGLVDMHAHLYPLLPSGIPAEAVCFSTGVTTAVDAGSSGCASYPYFRPLIHTSQLRIKAFLNVSTAGICAHPAHEDVDPAKFDEERIRDVFEACPGELLGLKLRTSRNIVEGYGLAPLERALEIADDIGVPLMLHPTDPPCTMARLLDMLRPGDIMSHAYHNTGDTIIDGSGHVCEAALRARERGVIFDVANDRWHFGFSTARAALADGFLPDVISSDLIGADVFRHPTVFSLPMLASKYLALGMSMEQILPRMTSVPARLMGLDGKIAALRPGYEADVAVFRMINREVEFGDRAYGDPRLECIRGDRLLKPMMTVKAGRIVFRDIDI